MRRAGRVAAALLLVAAAAPARAGVRFHIATEPASGGGKTRHLTVWVDGDRLALEARRPKAPPVARRLVFRASEDVMWLLDTSRSTYFQLDPESARKTADQVQGLRDGLETGLQSLGPEASARVREFLGDLAPATPAAPPEVELRPLGETAVHARLSCARTDVLSAGRRVAELCLAGWGQGPLRRERLPALPALGSFLARTLPPLLGAFPSLHGLAPLAALGDVDAVPIEGRSFESDGKATVTTLRKVEDVPIDPSLFELPASFARSWVPPF